MQDQSSLWFLENVNLFNVFCPKKSGESEAYKPKSYKKNEFIYFPNDASDTIYFIHQGKVKIGSYSEDGKEILKAVLTPGELFGEMALIGEEKRNDFAQAIENETQLCPLSLAEMESILLDNKELSIKLTKIIGLRLRKIERRLESLVFKDARTRIVDFIKEMGEERGQKVGFETLIRNPLTHQDMANLTGTSRQTVTTVLNELKEKNVINFDRRRILVRDMALLK
ncbi:Crp/Fnr family transcriptional regulator [Hyphobacterium sp. CCMP332]|nr:Crp/Fnr family transcriptional regulator [Hyphobacterium sp. CCMP332]